MPELPDVENFKRYFDSTGLHQEIDGVEVHSEQVLEDLSPGQLEEELKGHSFASTRRHGKYLFAHVSEDGWLVLHFGMTGDLKYFQKMEQEPEYDRLLVRFSNGYHLAYDSQRKLGEVRLADDFESFVEEKELGPDALDLDREPFREAISGSRAMAKSFLMDQSTLAGIGNVYGDEILFQASVHPRTHVDRLDEEEVDELFDTMREVLQTAIERQADPEAFPDDYLIPHREEGEPCPRCGEELATVKVSGRTAYYCPNRQGSSPRG
jgi:formamidopyrimidine-DNA glycosylase